MSSLPITAEIIDACRAAEACDEGLDWISAEPRTLAELCAYRFKWAEWLAIIVPSLSDAERAELHALTGCRSWWRDGQWHRDDGPAVECADGYRAWFRDGRLHRDDGPAVEYVDGRREWWRDGKRVPSPEVTR